jgi:hypothetical protein
MGSYLTAAMTIFSSTNSALALPPPPTSPIWAVWKDRNELERVFLDQTDNQMSRKMFLFALFTVILLLVSFGLIFSELRKRITFQDELDDAVDTLSTTDVNHTSNYILVTSNILVKRITDEVRYTSNYVERLIVPLTNYWKTDGSTTNIYLNQTGNVGIGTTPTTKLHVHEDTTNETKLTIQNNKSISSLLNCFNIKL